MGCKTQQCSGEVPRGSSMMLQSSPVLPWWFHCDGASEGGCRGCNKPGLARGCKSIGVWRPETLSRKMNQKGKRRKGKWKEQEAGGDGGEEK